MKFYNGHVERSWRCDDEQLAYPLYEKCRSLGIKVLQFHKGFPFGMSDLDAVRPIDLQRPARDFPDLTFLVHHLAMPYLDEMLWIAARFPNIWLSLASNLSFTPVAPRQVQEQLGKCLQLVGVDKLVWGSDAALMGNPTPYIKAFLDLEMPDDLRAGYGYPQITRADKAQILGLNFARLMGVDVAAKTRELAEVNG
jgi:predicted TIM-barrel fold metal-dependent hydrolase